MKVSQLGALIACVLFSTLPVAADDVAPKPLRIRVMTYNIRHGQGMDRKIDLPRIAAVIKESKADVVALQEVDVKTRRVGGVDQAAELGRLTEMHHAFGKAMDYDGGEYGNAILSRWKIEMHTTHALPHTKGNEPRAALDAVIRIGEKHCVGFISTHLDFKPDSTDRTNQIKALNEGFAKSPADENPFPRLLLGDMNATPKSEDIKLLREKWESAAHAPGMKAQPTVPSEKPTVLIDYVMFRPAKRWRVIEVQVIEEKVASDHRPVLAVLEFVR